MRFRWIVIVSAVAVCGSCGGPSAVRLQAEKTVTLHVGEVANITLPSEGHYTIGFAGTSLVLAQQSQQQDTTSFVYRAVNPGDDTLVATPGSSGPGQCVSCVTVHYFVKVVQSKP